MKFSVLLPTRNRLDLLKYAVETVRRQDYDDWEIIVSDNFSEEDIAGYLQSLNDCRIKYFRTESFVPVTDNWNNALDKCTGDYVIMLGDDDGLMKGYFSKTKGMIEKFQQPDFIHTGAYQYAYPGVVPAYPDGYLLKYAYDIYSYSPEAPFYLAKEQALDLVRQSMDFRIVFGYNMQFYLIRRDFIDSLKEKGPFFQSPYPDYYASNAIFLKAERILICPEPLVTIGVSPKSFGFFYTNRQEKQGMAFLKNLSDTDIANRLQKVILTGTNMNTSWLFSMEAVKVNYGSEYDLHVNYRRYRFLQILHVYKNCRKAKKQSIEELQESNDQLRILWSEMFLWEKLVFGVGLRAAYSVIDIIPKKQAQRVSNALLAMVNSHPEYDHQITTPCYSNILEVFEQVSLNHTL